MIPGFSVGSFSSLKNPSRGQQILYWLYPVWEVNPFPVSNLTLSFRNYSHSRKPTQLWLSVVRLSLSLSLSLSLLSLSSVLFMLDQFPTYAPRVFLLLLLASSLRILQVLLEAFFLPHGRTLFASAPQKRSNFNSGA